MKYALLFLLLASWLTACTQRHDDIPNDFWDSIALHDSVHLSDSLLQTGLQQSIEADDSLHVSMICFFRGRNFIRGISCFVHRNVTKRHSVICLPKRPHDSAWNWTLRKPTFVASIILRNEKTNC